MRKFLITFLRANDKYANCLGRCKYEVINTHELFVRTEDFLSFQRFFEPERLGESLRDVTSLRIECSQALLGEKVKPFHTSWVPFIAHLLELCIYDCRVSSLSPTVLRDFASLTTLRIDNADEGSPFMASEGGLEGLKNLASFSLTRVRLRMLNNSLFHNHTSNKLMKVYLSHNSLDDIDTCTFCGMQRLSDLDLSFNELTGTKMDFLNCIHDLYILNVSHNALTHIEINTFQYNEILHTVDLSNNRLRSFHSIVELINRTRSIKEIFMANNQWQCNITSLFQLRHLWNTRSVLVKDWNELRCLEKGQWVKVDPLVFPFSFSHVFRYWYLFVITGIFLLCLCSVLVVRCLVEPLDETLPVALWRFLRSQIIPSSERMEFPTGSFNSKLPRSKSFSGSKGQGMDAELSNSNCNDKQTNRENGITGDMSEVIISNIIVENAKDMNISAMPTPLSENGQLKNRTKDKDDIEEEEGYVQKGKSSYVSYKTSLDQDIREMKNDNTYVRKNQSDAIKTSSKGKKNITSNKEEITYRSKNDKTSGAAKTKSGTVSGLEQKTDVIAEVTGKCDGTQADEDLPLTTSAGVATTPTGTQTTAMAGMRNRTHFGLSSWTTVAHPRQSSSLDNSEVSPHHHLPTPIELAAAKRRRRDTADTIDFTLHSPPRPSQSQNGRRPSTDMLRSGGSTESTSKQQQTFLRESQPVILEERRSLRNVWSSSRVYPSGTSTERPVCPSCLEALSLPDMNDTTYLCEEERTQRSFMERKVALRQTSTSLRQQRITRLGHKDDGGLSPFNRSRYSHYIKRPGKALSEKTYRSLERGIRRRTMDYRRRISSQESPQKHFHRDHIDVSPLRDVAHHSGCLQRISDPAIQREADERKLEGTPSRTRSKGKEEANIGMAMISRERNTNSSLADKEGAQRGNSEYDAKDKVLREEDSSLKEFQHRTLEASRRYSSSTSTTAGGDDDHCDIDIETQASQIIDIVELHAQSNCKAS